MDDEYAVKPPYGRRSILGIIEGRALHEPARPWLHVPRSSNPKDGWKPITYAEGINAIDRAAHKVTENVGEPPRDAFPTVAYIGPSDVRYIIFAFGMVKAGYKVSLLLYTFPSPSLGPCASRRKSDAQLLVPRHCSYHHGTPTRGR